MWQPDSLFDDSLMHGDWYADDLTRKTSKDADEAQKNYEDRYWVHAM